VIVGNTVGVSVGSDSVGAVVSEGKGVSVVRAGGLVATEGDAQEEMSRRKRQEQRRMRAGMYCDMDGILTDIRAHEFSLLRMNSFLSLRTLTGKKCIPILNGKTSRHVPVREVSISPT